MSRRRHQTSGSKVGNTIESRISLARKASTKKKKTAGAIVGLILVTVFIVAGTYFTVPSWTIDNKAVNTTKRDTDNEKGDQADHKATFAQRDAFKRQLKKFQSEVVPALSAASVDKWATDEYNDIFERKDKALQIFNAGNYPSAATLLQGAFEAADKVLQLAEEKFHLYMDAANRAFNSGDVGTAQANITQALLLKPDDPVAGALKARITVLPEVLRLSALADKARAENDHTSWKTYLEKIVRLDPARKSLQTQLREVTREITDRDFASHIIKGMEAIRIRDLHAAKNSLAQARKIYPAKDETVLLHQNVQRLEREHAVQQHLDAAREAIVRDDWAGAHTYFQQARSVDDTDTAAANGVKLAARILNAHKDIAGYLAQPWRLSSENVAAAARAGLQKAEDLYQKSPSLASQGRALAAIITEYGTPLEVVIHSDNKTDILVRGVGKVGKVLKKTVLLKPGTYTLEGKRVGYRSKLIQIEVRRNDKSPEIVLACDEPV